MNIIQFIENMKEKPEYIRKRFAFILSFSFSSLLFIGWIVSYNFTESSVLTDKNNLNNSIVESPVSSITASVLNGLNGIKNIFTGTNKIEYKSENFLEIKAGNK
ncbi:MAG: hypothetical protein AAB683_02510 [Patescibacteria group bacterium]